MITFTRGNNFPKIIYEKKSLAIVYKRIFNFPHCDIVLGGTKTISSGLFTGYTKRPQDTKEARS